MYKVPLMRPSLPKKEDFLKVVDELWETRQLSNFGKYAILMEEEAKSIFKSDRCFKSVVSCDVGLTLAIRAFDFPEGSEVLVQSFTFNSTPNTILWNNLKPVFVDVDLKDFCIDTLKLESYITKKTVAIVATHIFGNTADLAYLEDFALKHNLKLIFDAAHAFGSMRQGKHVCEYGDAGVYSFSGTKLITSGEGGLAYFKDKAIADKFTAIRQYGFIGDYNTKDLGMNGKISEIHSALVYLSMQNLNPIMEKRQKLATTYRDGLKGCKFQEINPDTTSTFKDFAILVENRDAVYDFLEKNGIQSKKYFFPAHKNDFWKKYIGENKTDLSNTDYIYDHILCLPIYNEISDEEVEYVIDTINSIEDLQ